jgi:cell division protein FtsB
MPSLRWIFVAAVPLLLVSIMGTTYFFEFRRISHLYEAVEKGSARLAETERSVEEYREKVAFYKTDEGIIHMARKEYNLAFPNDRVFFLVKTSPDLDSIK